jgi:hypothetical protein
MIDPLDRGVPPVLVDHGVSAAAGPRSRKVSKDAEVGLRQLVWDKSVAMIRRISPARYRTLRQGGAATPPAQNGAGHHLYDRS